MARRNPYICQPGKRVRLKKCDPAFTAEFDNEEEAQESLQKTAADLAKYQDILMAHERHGLLILFQGMDGAGKDSAIKHVMSSVDPQGCEVKMFKRMTEKESRHDFLWRAARAMPARGQIGIFNRSYYEQVIADRLHPEHLDEQKLPMTARTGNLWRRRYRHINNFEQYLVENGIHVLKFFLHLSKEMQRERLLERMSRSDKKWKFSTSDVRERDLWNEYMKIYEEVLSDTSTRYAQWHIIPADNRWFARAIIASIVVTKLKSLHTKYPALGKEEKREMEKAQAKLEGEDHRRVNKLIDGTAGTEETNKL